MWNTQDFTCSLPMRVLLLLGAELTCSAESSEYSTTESCPPLAANTPTCSNSIYCLSHFQGRWQLECYTGPTPQCSTVLECYTGPTQQCSTVLQARKPPHHEHFTTFFTNCLCRRTRPNGKAILLPIWRGRPTLKLHRLGQDSYPRQAIPSRTGYLWASVLLNCLRHWSPPTFP
jgi:hypothetical protein